MPHHQGAALPLTVATSALFAASDTFEPMRRPKSDVLETVDKDFSWFLLRIITDFCCFILSP